MPKHDVRPWPLQGGVLPELVVVLMSVFRVCVLAQLGVLCILFGSCVSVGGVPRYLCGPQGVSVAYVRVQL